MNEIGVRGSETGGTHVCGNLPTMIGRVQNHVHEDVLFLAGPTFALAIFVGQRTGQAVLLQRHQVLLPKLGQLFDFQFALFERKIGPNRISLLL